MDTQETPFVTTASTVEVLNGDRISFDGPAGPWHRVVSVTPSTITHVEEGVAEALRVQTARDSATSIHLSTGLVTGTCSVSGCLRPPTQRSGPKCLCWDHFEDLNEQQERIREVVAGEVEAAWERAHALETRILEAGPR